MTHSSIKTIGFIGCGGVNSRIARLSVSAGFHVALSNSRGPESLRDMVRELGPRATAVASNDVATNADIVIVSVPFSHLEKLAVPPAALDGKVVIDTMNYYPQRDGNISALDTRELTSSEWVQRRLEGAHVVKALYNLDLFHLENGAVHGRRWALPIAGNDTASKDLVTSFMDAIGYEAVDCGLLEDSWKIEANTPLYLSPYVGPMPADIKTKEEAMYWYKQDVAASVTRDDVLRLAGQATRDATVGGALDSAPSAWIDWVLWMMHH